MTYGLAYSGTKKGNGFISSRHRVSELLLSSKNITGKMEQIQQHEWEFIRNTGVFLIDQCIYCQTKREVTAEKTGYDTRYYLNDDFTVEEPACITRPAKESVKPVANNDHTWIEDCIHKYGPAFICELCGHDGGLPNPVIINKPAKEAAENE